LIELEPSSPESNTPSHSSSWVSWLGIGLLVVILAVGAYFRMVGINWDGTYHLHPDERFLTMVETGISPVKSLGEYFNTSNSSLNPNNQGYGFYVYGTLPLFIVRYVAEWIEKTGYDQVHLVGRYASAFMDLMTVLLVYLVALRLYKRKLLALLAAAFAAFAVLPIQLSHFFTVDTFTNFFSFLAFFIAVVIMDTHYSPSTEPLPTSKAVDDGEVPGIEEPLEKSDFDWRSLFKSWDTGIPYALFGIVLGLAMASKVSAAPLAVILPAAAWIYYSRLPPEVRKSQTGIILRNLVIAGFMTILVFRIFQPYAFSGPGFFGIKLNPNWLSNISELNQQSSGDTDFPPALQWARRPITFAWDNMVKWGLGLPLGLLAWAGFLWMGWRMFKENWRQHALIWVWTAVYFAWWSINFTRSMRYQLPVYPTLEIMAAWAVFELGDLKVQRLPQHLFKILGVMVGVSVLLGTFAWAFAFTRIYTRPVTRVAASEWIYQNVPGPINLEIQTGSGEKNQPLPFSNSFSLQPGRSMVIAFQPSHQGNLSELNFAHIKDSTNSGSITTLGAIIKDDPKADNSLTIGFISQTFITEDDPRGKDYKLKFNNPIPIEKGRTYYLVLNIDGSGSGLELAGSLTMGISDQNGILQQALPDPVEALNPGSFFVQQFVSFQAGTLQKIYFPHIVDWAAQPGQKTLLLSIYKLSLEGEPLASASLVSDFPGSNDRRGQEFTAVFDQPVSFELGQTYYLKIKFQDGNGTIVLYGSKGAVESTWDDVIPLGMFGFNPYDYNNGIYRSDLNFEMYWDDNQDKLDRFLTILNQADYIFISSNRQWGTTVRVPERYPLTSVYYRNLLGCPDDREIVWCYNVADTGMFSGKLGFDLVKVDQSDPNLGLLRFNTQFAEEAFTVYDAPKVMIFHKSASYNQDQVRSLLQGVDLTQIVHLTPSKASSYPGNLMLPLTRLSVERAGGTWSELFNWEALQNRYQWIGLILWYLVISLLGWINYPFIRLALGGLSDKGFPFTRLVGMALLAYVTWLAGSASIPVTRMTITIVAIGLLLINAVLFYLQREAILQEIKEYKKYILVIEFLTLAFFIFFLLVRLGNPDLWHPSKGGEKPMDFSYLNAVIKSTTYPPYDPWFAGGYINYYYYGFVLVGVLVKWLGIVPSIAYNLILPSFFSMTAMGAFCIGWNLLHGLKKPQLTVLSESCVEVEGKSNHLLLGLERWPLLAGLASSIGLLVLGNLGTVRMIWQGFQKLAAPGGAIENLTIPMRWFYSFRGLITFISGTPLPYPPGDWYWIPSRVYPNEPITEFPFFTFLYADPHAHMFALPLTLLALVWALSILKGRWQWGDKRHVPGWLQFGCSFILGGIVIGSLRPTNTWDLPTYLVIGVAAILYSGIKYGKFSETIVPGLSSTGRQILIASFSALLLVAISFLFFAPYAHWYGQGYNAIDLWKGDHSPFWSYITHWGLFLFVIVSWLVWETRDWMAKTPVSALNKLLPYKGLIGGFLVLLVGIIISLLILGVAIAWLVLPLSMWAALLIFRPGQPDVKRAVLFFIGSALVLTLAVELVVLRGDIGRMNTVFKFYLQAWTLFSISAAASLIWLWPAVRDEWLSGWRITWQTGLAMLVGGALLFTLLGGADKIRDRMSKTAPHTLDGMAYMATSTYSDNDKDMDLSQDYRAILWMQENIQGSPVIVEANTVEYRWGSRYTIYTGLPGVVGWNWHQRQQRAVVPSEWVTNRVQEIGDFYRSTDRQQTTNFLKKYDVRYIIVGQLEQAYFAGEGLDKFMAWNGDLWKEIYRDSNTVIYEVLQ